MDAPGAYELSGHERHEVTGSRYSASPAVSVYAVAFSAGLPPGDA